MSVANNAEIHADEDGNLVPPPGTNRAPRDLHNHEEDSDDEQEVADRVLHMDPAINDEQIVRNPAHFADNNWRRFDVIELPVFIGRNIQARPQAHIPVKLNGRQEYKGAHDLPPSASEHPVGLLELFFTDEILDTFVSETNAYVRHQTSPAWGMQRELNRNELKMFFGLILYMGVKQIADIRYYWEATVYGDPFVKAIMSRKRFEAILYNLHWLDAYYVWELL